MILGLIIGGTAGYLIGSGTKVKVERRRNPKSKKAIKQNQWARFGATK